MTSTVPTRPVCGAMFVLLSIGCGRGADYNGPPRAAVHGRVTFDGAPLAAGAISFIPEDETMRTVSAVISGGRYNLTEGKGPNFGKYKVVISGLPAAAGPAGEAEASEDEESASDEDDSEDQAGRPVEAGPLGRFVVAGNVIAAKYNTDTELVREITSSNHTFDFDLKSE